MEEPEDVSTPLSQSESHHEKQSINEEKEKREGSNMKWLEAATKQISTKKHELRVQIVDGAEMVEVPDDLIKKSIPLWEDFLQGRFLSKAPHVAKIHMIVNKIWPVGEKPGKIEVFEVDDVTVKFRIKDARLRARVLRRGMWNIAGIPLIITKWSPIEEEKVEEEVKVIPMWVTLKKVPHQMYSWECLEFIASAVGKPVRLHPDTIMCTNFEEAKVFVEADMTKELPKQYRFKSKSGIDAAVDFIYPWLPLKCKCCSKWGHVEAKCVKAGRGKEDGKLKEKETLGSPSSGDSQEISKSTPLEKHVEAKRDSEEFLEKEMNEAEKAKVDGEWTDVTSPGKRRQQGRAVEEEIFLTSPSRFAVLADDEEELHTEQER
ncbi:hypothetical protein N665_1497s0005 [Sinapis alba]|nr:hypothetical protein N665_1497s0005 [Sinapis alba]